MRVKGFVDLFVRGNADSIGRLCALAGSGGYGALGVIADLEASEFDGIATIPVVDALKPDGTMANIRTSQDLLGAGMIYGGRALGGKSELLRNVMAYCSGLGCRLALVPDEEPLTRGALVSEGRASSVSGMKGFPVVAESIGIFRALEMAGEYDIPLHLHGVSTSRGLDMVKEAKAKGVDVTCSVTSFSLCLTEEDLIKSRWDPYLKTEIPLRSDSDRKALWEGVEDGTVDAITSGHVQISEEDKMVPFPEAPFGFETLPDAALSLLRTRRSEFPYVSEEKLLECLTSGPAGLLGLEHEGDLSRIADGYL
jgi:dihydroorotase